ncbi:hypothetical protein [Roseimaritima multifibrata]|uniref:hypothetical protein n=1 Tax=Roseimaritima multifibrata TaxID=1930274 RepID=UPI00119EA85D|nr:hypothetical protein [Roseimaritima multifibrata]
MSKRRVSRPRSSAHSGPSAEQASSSANPLASKTARDRLAWLPFVCLVALLLLIVCQPISGDGLWWEMSRGRAAWEGQPQPSASLLSLESGSEADWLGGLPLYAVQQTLGFNGWMLFRLAFLAIVGGFLWKKQRSKEGLTPRLLVLLGLTTITLSESLSLQPVVYDLIGIAGLPLWILYRFRTTAPKDSADEPAADVPPQSLFVGLLLAFAVWSNLAAGIAFGGILCVLALFDAWKQTVISSKWFVACLAAITIGGCCNPRGIFAWNDSLQALLPFIPNPTYVLAGTEWGSMLQNAWGWQEFYFLALTATWIVDLFINTTDNRRTNRFDLLSFAVAQWFAWASLQNLPLAILWMTGNLAFRWRRPIAGIETVAASPGDVQCTGDLSPDGSVIKRMGIPILLLFAAAWSSGLFATFGWGVDQRQDYRLLRNSLQETHPHGTAFADTTRSAAMLAWVLPELPSPLAGQEKLQLQDIPLRAVRRGRLEQHIRLLSDLKRNRLMRYWRTDGSAGGYWLTFAERDTSLLCISNHNLDLIRGLEETPWKPLSLDSATLPFAFAGDEGYVRRMIQILQNRETIEHRYWQYEPPTSTGSAFDRDRFGGALDSISPQAIFEQAEVFRAMDLHYAALRVLTVGRARFPGDPFLLASFFRCQRELADQERIDAGSASWFRSLAADTTDQPNSTSDDSSFLLMEGSDPPITSDDIPAAAEPLQILVDTYIQSGATAMLSDYAEEAYNEASPQFLYGCLCAALESGAYDLADQLVLQLKQQPLASPIRELVLAREIEYRPERFNESPAVDTSGKEGEK